MSWKEILKDDKIEKSLLLAAGGVLAAIVFYKYDKKVNQILTDSAMKEVTNDLAKVMQNDPPLMEKLLSQYKSSQQFMGEGTEFSSSKTHSTIDYFVNLLGMPKLEELAREVQLPQMIQQSNTKESHSTVSGTQLPQMKDVL